jgi:branched-subunit amino acid aminotransferase/4-amino-4-deoxychorismate lyase
MSTRLFGFSGERLGAIEWCDPVAGETLVADSWRVQDSDVVGLERHHDRFITSALASGLEKNTLIRFWDEVIARLPRAGSWFPRVEVTATRGGPTLRYRERPAPAWSAEVTLALGSSDPRSRPLIKGPDLEALMALRGSVAPLGAQEALIVSEQGTLIEGAYSTLMIWEHGSTELSVVPSATPRIPSVTEAILREIALSEGVAVRERELTLDQLAGADVWVLSASQGIRLAVSVVGAAPLAPERERRDAWQSLWWAKRESLPGALGIGESSPTTQ